MSKSHSKDSGVALVAVLATLIPAVVLVMASTNLLRSHSKSLGTELDQERALLAAESGVDYVVHQANTVGLTMGEVIEVDMGAGLSFAVVPTDLLTDKADNDDDKLIDEPDEEAVELRSTGRFRDARRNVVAYIRPMFKFPLIDAAVSFQDFGGSLNTELDASGNAFEIKGNDHKLDGSPGNSPAQHGVAIVQPGTVAKLLGDLSSNQQKNITGAGGTPSATTSNNVLNITEMANWAQSVANSYIQPGKYASKDLSLGDAKANDWQVSYCAGDLSLSGNLSGAGILVVMGNLEITGTVDYMGLVIVVGDVTMKGGGGDTVIRGGMMAGKNLDLSGNVSIQYSDQIIQIVKESLAEKKVVTGWREVASH